MNNPKNAPRTASQSAPNQIIQQAQAKAQQNPGDIDKLKAVSAPRSNYPHQIYQRARAVWLAVTGQYTSCNKIAKRIESYAATVKDWIELYINEGIEALLSYKHDGGRPTKLSTTAIALLETLLMFKPHALVENGYFPKFHDELVGRSRWTQAAMAKVMGLAESTMSQIVNRLNIPYFKGGKSDYCFSTDPNFIGKVILIDLLRLFGEELGYEVWSFDEKTCIQAIRREMAVNMGGMQINLDRYIRNGTTNLLAMLRPATGYVHAAFTDEKKAKDVVAFITSLLEQHKTDRKIVIIVDNLSTHFAMKQLESKYPQLIVAFTPTNASWINAIESFFGILAKSILKGRSDDDIGQLQSDVLRFIDEHNRTADHVNWDFDVKRRIYQRVNSWAILKRELPNMEHLRDLGKNLLSTEACEFLAHSGKLNSLEHVTSYDNGNLLLLKDGAIEDIQDNAKRPQDALEAYHPVPSKQREALCLDDPLGCILSDEVLEAYTDLEKARALIEKLFAVLPQKPYRNAASQEVRKGDIAKLEAELQATSDDIQFKQQQLDQAQAKRDANLGMYPSNFVGPIKEVMQENQIIGSLLEQLFKANRHRDFVRDQLEKRKRKYDKQCHAAKGTFSEIKDGLLKRLDSVLALWRKEQAAYNQRMERAPTKPKQSQAKLWA